MVAKKTPLYEEHVKLGGKMVDYAGWFLPVQYEGLIPEHEAVRNAAGLFDVSHMGEIVVKGKDALDYLQYLTTNDIASIDTNQVIYTLMCYPDGGVVDDFLVYKYADDKYLLVVNAANTEKDFKWMIDNKDDFNIIIENISNQIGEVAIQGPKSEKILQKLTEKDLSKIKPFHFDKEVNIAGVECMVSRTGYTGEDGFEIYTSKDDIVKVWNAILEAGKDEGLKPAGLGCRDTLRFEAGMPLYGNEISEDITPLEGGLKFAVKLDKEEDFIGKDALKKQWEEGLTRKVVGFELLERGIPREGYEVYKDGKKIGHVTTGYMSPTLKKSIGNALIDINEAKIGNEIDIMIRNKPVKAKIISRKFLNK
ncbi:aminomethyltransferase [Keratinibaculum paraultunense]|uniref:Aminomethyltransferase n=1 Tax=Keratinibaculum paraultunense TaxID=1278232 RepID=A0A4R3KNM6_9FIRM|nr:glycine cleavage system aminomethyltransferase GcvT [Keratinibaculum paraultunense]QQY79379.1 glycine cleavage system aminomethyltransferase GcvT [Keratinibaculum paraultunense]TCS86125.1 aminomethyltransferase [Keratinibaculum paraultunense]